jgi:hypothetical protein
MKFFFWPMSRAYEILSICSRSRSSHLASPDFFKSVLFVNQLAMIRTFTRPDSPRVLLFSNSVPCMAWLVRTNQLSITLISNRTSMKVTDMVIKMTDNLSAENITPSTSVSLRAQPTRYYKTMSYSFRADRWYLQCSADIFVLDITFFL